MPSDFGAGIISTNFGPSDCFRREPKDQVFRYPKTQQIKVGFKNLRYVLNALKM
jgi:hypothetical protein